MIRHPSKVSTVFILLGVYFLLQMVVRVCLSPGANLDEAEELVLTQGLRWGYGSQPPLYMWLQSGVFSVLGINILALTLLKNLFLFTTYVVTYLSARELTENKSAALLGTIGLLFIPQIVWESQRDLTHSVLVTTMAASALLFFLRLYRTRQMVYYWLFGLATGLGVLSKYNFAVFLFALLAAALSLREFRPAILNKRFYATIAAFVLLTGLHFHWALTHPDAALFQNQQLTVVDNGHHLAAYGKGIWSLVKATGTFLGLLIFGYVALFGARAVRDEFRPKTEQERLIYRVVWIALGFCLVMIIAFKAHYKDRWMQPLLFAMPIYLASRLQYRLDPVRLKRAFIASGAVATCVLVILPSDTILSSLSNHYTRLNAPFVAMDEKLKGAPFDSGVIIAENRFLGGNLRMSFPGSCIEVPELTIFPPPKDSPTLLVWDATQNQEAPASLVEFAGRLGHMNVGSSKPRYVEAPYLYSHRKNMRLGFILIPRRHHS